MALANIMEDDFMELMCEEAGDVFIDGRVVQGQGIVGGLINERMEKLWLRLGFRYITR